MEEHNPESHHDDVKTQIKEEKKLEDKIRLNPWMVISIILVLVVLGVIFIPNPLTGKAISADEAGNTLVEFLNAKVGGGVVLDSVDDKGDIYEVNVIYQNMTIPVYITKDGKYFVQGIEEIVEGEDGGDVTPPPGPQDQTPEEVPKTNIPIVELFVMSHCPYGTQAEKGIIPVAKLLGDKINFKIRFVYYAMHGETEVLEQLNQYCIQEEQNDKFIPYLECFLEEGDGESCLTESGIDMDALTSCTEAADEEFDITANLEDEESWLSGRFPKFEIDLADNEKYGIGGSPSLIINGVQSSAGRDSASYLAGICNAFSESPEECNEELSSASPSPGFGGGTSDSGSDAQCG